MPALGSVMARLAPSAVVARFQRSLRSVVRISNGRHFDCAALLACHATICLTDGHNDESVSAYGWSKCG
jgi:hypothetical protein